VTGTISPNGVRNGDAPAEQIAPRAMPSPAPVAYIMSRFPLLTETFILREMLELERQEVPLTIFPLLREQPSVRHDEVGRLRAKVYYTPFLSAAIIAANASFLRRNPRRYLGLLWSVLKGNWGSANLFVGALGIFPKSVYLARLAEEQGVGHVHAHFATHPALCALIISKLTGVGYSITVHAHDIFLHQRMLTEKLEGARFVASISMYNKDYLQRLVPGVEPDKIKIVHCGIELENYDALGESPSDRQAPSDDRITAICVASLQPYKGIKYLIRACAQVVASTPDFRCLVVGQGADRAKLEALIDEMGLRENVYLLGGKPQHEVAALLRTADMFVLPSVVAPSGQMEGIPVALMEAMATRLPVVSTRLSGIPELVEDGVSGLLVSPADEAALADAITTLSADAELRRSMGERGRERVAAEFELKGSVASLRALFAEAVDCTRARRLPAHREDVSDGADHLDPAIVDWVKAEISRAGGAAGDILVDRLGGGADSDVFEVRHAAGGERPAGLILKLYRPNGARDAEIIERSKADAENDFRALSFFYGLFSRHSARFAIPRPVALELDYAAVLMEKCSGERLDRAMRWARFRRGARASLPGWFASCGEWLAIFHQATASQEDPSPVFTRMERDFFENLELCRKRGLDAVLASLAARRFEADKGAAFDRQLGLVGRHCDFAPYNVLVSGDRVSVIDFEGLQEGVLYEDLCYFLRMLEVTPPYHLGRSTIAALRESFLAGYERRRDLDRGALDFFMLLVTVKVMANAPILRPPATWRDALKRRQRLGFYRGWFREMLS